MWETTILPLLSTWWPVLAVVAGVAIFIYLLRYVLTNSKVQSILATIVSSEAAIISVFGGNAEAIFLILKQIQKAISDEKLTVLEAQKIAENIIKEAFDKLDIELSVAYWAVLKFVVNKMIEAIVLYGQSDEVEKILVNMTKNINVAKIEMYTLNSKNSKK
jgi:hypothetical protein